MQIIRLTSETDYLLKKKELFFLDEYSAGLYRIS